MEEISKHRGIKQDLPEYWFLFKFLQRNKSIAPTSAFQLFLRKESIFLNPKIKLEVCKHKNEAFNLTK